jgi:hypothetical protein
MKRVLAILVFTLGVLITFSFTAGPVRADTIVFQDPLIEPPGIQEINNFDPFKITINEQGNFARNFVNLTGQLIADFHFVTDRPGDPIAGFDISNPRAFEDTTGTPTSIDFVMGSTGGGINNERVFSIVMGGFAPGTMITVTPTPVPEPSTMLLLGSGLAGVAATARARRKAKTSTPPIGKS